MNNQNGINSNRLMNVRTADVSELIENMKDSSFVHLMKTMSDTMKDPEEWKKFERDVENIDKVQFELIAGSKSSNLLSKPVKINISPPEVPVENIIPEKSFCIVGTSDLYQDYVFTKVEIFINFCWSERIANFQTELLCAHGHHHDPHTITTGKVNPKDHHYKIPYVIDRVYKSNKLRIYDFVVGRKTIRCARQQDDFKNVLIHTSLEAIEELYGEVIDPKSLSISQNTIYKTMPGSDTKSSDPIASVAKSDLKFDLVDVLKIVASPKPLNFTNEQRKMIFEQVSFYASNHGSLPFITSISPEVQLKSLYMTIPKVLCKQTSDHIIMKLAFDQTKLAVNSIKFCVYSKDIDSKPDQADFLDLQFNSLQGYEYGLHLKLFGKVQLNRCLATFENDNLILVLEKQHPNVIWTFPVSK